MVKKTEEEVKTLKAQLKEAEDRLKAEKAEERRIEREKQRNALIEKTLMFQNDNATEVVGEPEHWFDVYRAFSGSFEVSEYKWDMYQSTFNFSQEEALKLRDILIESYPA